MAEVTLRVYRSGSAQNLIDFGTDGEYVDLDLNQQSVNFKVEMSSVQNQDLGKMYALGSQQFALPSTTINDAFFNYSSDPGSVDDNLMLQKIFDCQVLVDGGSIANGKLFIDSIVKKESGEVLYNCSFNDSVAGLNEYLKDVGLGDLGWVDYDHQYSLTNITSSWEGNLFSGEIVYPLIQGGNIESDTFVYTMDENNPNSIFGNGKLVTQTFKPAVRIKTILDRIFDLVPFEYSSSFIEGGAGFFGASGKTMDDLYMLMTADEERGIVDSVPNLVILSSNDQAYSGDQLIDIKDFTSEVVDTSNQYDPVTGKFTAALGGTYNFSIVPLVIGTPASNTVRVQTRIYEFGTSTILANSPTSDPVNESVAGTPIEGVSLTLDLYEGQEIELKVQTNANPNAPTYNLGAICEYECLTPQPDVTILDEQFGDLTALDFLRGLQQHFNLVFWTDRDNPNTINIEPYNTWVDSGVRLDWTDKIDKSKGIEIFHPAREQNKYVTFTYKEDQGQPNEYNKNLYGKELGTFEYESVSDYSQGELSIGDSFFAQTIVSPLQGAGSNLSGSNMVIPKIYNEDLAPYKFEPRLLFNMGTGSLSNKTYTIFDDVFNNEDTFSYYPQFSQATSFVAGNDKFTLDWQPQGYWRGYNGIQGYGHWSTNNLFNNFWARWVNNIYRSSARKMVCNVKFSPADIFEFNLNDLVHIDGHDWRINKISGFNLLQDESVKVELLKELQPINSAVYLNGSNTITGADGGYSGPGTPTNGDEFTWVDDTYTDDEVVPTTTPDNTGPSGPDTPIDPAEISQVQIVKGGYKPSTDTGTGIVTIKANVNIGRNSLGDTSTAAVQNSATNKPIAGDNNNVSPTSTFVSIVGDGNEVGGGAKRIAIVGDNNNITPGANQVLVVGDNFDTSGGGTIDTTVLIGNQGSTLPDNTEITNALIVGRANHIQTTFNESVSMGRNAIIQGTNGFQDCMLSVYGTVDADDYVGAGAALIASTLLGAPVITQFDNGTSTSLYNTAVIQGKTFEMGSRFKGYVTVAAMGAGAAYTVTTTDNVIFVTGTGGAGTISLPSAVTNDGRVIIFKSQEVSAGGGTANISATAGNIDGSASYTFGLTDYESITVMSDGSDWWIISTGP